MVSINRMSVWMCAYERVKCACVSLLSIYNMCVFLDLFNNFCKLMYVI